MSTKNMLIVKDARGEIIAAQVEEPVDSGVMTYIAPAQKEHTLHRINDVPAEIHDLANPMEFQKAITDHVKSAGAKVTQTNVQELEASFASRLSK